MNKQITCSGCQEIYVIDLKKYGGKKIKCKKCSAIISVPHPEPGPDDFEVIPDTVSQVVPKDSAIKGVNVPGILNKNRNLGVRTSVNIALLQRSEKSRMEIREAFFNLHGVEEKRNAAEVDISKSLENVNDEISSLAAKMSALKEAFSRGQSIQNDFVPGVTWYHPLIAPQTKNDIMAFVLADNPFQRVKTFTEICQNAENAYAEAVNVLGRPIKVAVKKKPKESQGFFASIFDTTSDKDYAYIAERDGKLATIQGAIDFLDNEIEKLNEKKLKISHEFFESQSLPSKITNSGIIFAKEKISQGDFQAAGQTLSNLLKTSPTDLLASVLVLLAKCSYGSGNMTGAARTIQDAICFGATAPFDGDEGFNDLWAKSAAGLPKV